VASNDINEPVLHKLRESGHEIDVFGIGTNLVTCQAQPALGMVFKLVESRGMPRIKLSQEPEKVTLPGRKAVYRLYNSEDQPMMDVMTLVTEEAPVPGKEFFCRHPIHENERVHVKPSRVEKILNVVFENGSAVKLPTLDQSRTHLLDQLKTFKPQVLDLKEPEKYPVLLSFGLYEIFHKVWMEECPIKTMS